MNKLQLPQAKLLYAIGQAYRKRRIDENQKRMLKEKIITDNVEIFQLLEQTDDQNVLIDKLVQLIRAGQPQQNNSPAVNGPPVPTQQEQASSPWGQFLRRRKINQQHDHKNQTKGIQSLLHMEKTQ